MVDVREGISTSQLLRSLAAARGPAAALRRLQQGSGAFALHETVAAARPALIAALYRALGGQVLVVVPTADLAERTFTDLIYYLGEQDEPQNVGLLRARD